MNLFMSKLSCSRVFYIVLDGVFFIPEKPGRQDVPSPDIIPNKADSVSTAVRCDEFFHMIGYNESGKKREVIGMGKA
jgi:hypothetical protein